MQQYLPILFIILITLFILYLILKSPYHYPYFYHVFDVSGKRRPNIDDLIDNYIISGHSDLIQSHYEMVEKWKEENIAKIEKTKILKNYRKNQFYRCLDDDNLFYFELDRKQTRYKQKNYVKHSYQTMVAINGFGYSYEYLYNRYKALEEINFECTLNQYHSKNQRKLMTKALRNKIMKRDNYTCQKCGKYMPDEIGLHIDHIIPISKGGKTVESNLQVLCSKCNGHKSNRT